MAENNDLNSLTYSQALNELEQILAALRSEACDIDTLSSRTKRAAELLAYCRTKLTRTESELSKVLEELDGTLRQ